MKEVGGWCQEKKIKVLTVFAFSQENWQREAAEVSYLFELFYEALTKEIEEYQRRDIRVRVIGRIDGLPANVAAAAREIAEKTKNHQGGLLQLAINYGGRAEIVDAVQTLVRSGLAAEEITEEVIARHLYSSDVPSPDLIIRTSGEQRLSGFLTWQSAYSELYFVTHHWPDFSRSDFEAALNWYESRKRRFGK